MDEEKNGLTTDEYTKDELTYTQYKKQKQTELLDADEELMSLVSAQRANKGEGEEDEKEAENKLREYLKTHNEGKKNNEYLVRGAELQCSCGSHTRKLNLNTCHGVYMKGHPVVHELDCASGDGNNITWFGVCDHEDFESERIIVTNQDGSKKCGLKCNPKLIGVWMDSYEGTKIVDNSYKDYAKRLGLKFRLPQLDGPDVLKSAEEGEERHIPQINLNHDLIQIDRLKGNWSMDNGDDTEDALEGYACNVLTVGSFLVCQHGGIISPVNSGQDRTVRLEEFVEGWNAYRRVVEPDDVDVKQLLKIQEGSAGRGQNGVTLYSYLAHNASNKQVLGFLNLLTFPELSKKVIKKHIINNYMILAKQTIMGREEGSAVFFKPNQYIENQQEWESVSFGKKDMKYAGCEIIATYNARFSLGENMTEKEMVKLISSYERDGVVLEGEWGVAPTAVYRYFQSKGYNVGMTTSMEKEDINAYGENYDTIIISFFNNQDTVGGGIHTVNVSKEEDGYVCHNDYNTKGTSGIYIAKDAEKSLWEVVMKLSGGDAKPICIVGIDKKVSEEEDDEKKNK